MKSVIISAMFFKWIKLPILVVLALIIHLFSAQHDSASALVLCFGDDGHVAFELVQQQNAHVNSQTDQVDVFGNVERIISPAVCHDILHFFVRVLVTIGLRQPRQHYPWDENATLA